MFHIIQIITQVRVTQYASSSSSAISLASSRSWASLSRLSSADSSSLLYDLGGNLMARTCNCKLNTGETKILVLSTPYLS